MVSQVEARNDHELRALVRRCNGACKTIQIPRHPREAVELIIISMGSGSHPVASHVR